MKLIVLFILFTSTYANSCIIGPRSIPDPLDITFSIVSEPGAFCDSCNMISVMTSPEYEGHPFSHALFSVYKKSELISKSLISPSNGSQMIELSAIVASSPDIEYEITVE